MPALFARAILRQLGPCPAPWRCPHCPGDTPRHWIRWGYYERYAGDREHPSNKVVVPRYRCKIVARTFSLLPHALLPYCSIRTGLVLAWLHVLHVEATPLSLLARQARVSRSALRRLSVGFRRARQALRLPAQPAALTGALFLEALAPLAATTVVPLFQAWKESEPKLSVVGIHRR